MPSANLASGAWDAVDVLSDWYSPGDDVFDSTLLDFMVPDVPPHWGSYGPSDTSPENPQ